ncbi:MAG: 50S ribosomal protein L5 [Candidatus Harrisonbacteria bacterium]|nr:50S ribosomal protein L5 [Candidatus Harrisonbacteria bacterium]
MTKDMTKEKYKNLEKIVVNTGVGRLSSQPNFEEKILPEVIKEMSFLTGQKPAVRPAKISIAGFKLRSGTAVGLKTTLRKQRMEEFLKKVIRVVLPRVRDFRGLKKESVDKSGNLTIGLKEYLVFPEINSEVAKTNFGLEITIVPKLKKKEKAMELYKELGIPFKK